MTRSVHVPFVYKIKLCPASSIQSEYQPINSSKGWFWMWQNVQILINIIIICRTNILRDAASTPVTMIFSCALYIGKEDFFVQVRISSRFFFFFILSYIIVLFLQKSNAPANLQSRIFLGDQQLSSAYSLLSTIYTFIIYGFSSF